MAEAMVIFSLDMLLLVTLVLLGLPLVFCFGGALMFMSIFFHINMASLLLWSFNQIVNPILLTIPLFVLAGGLISKSGISENLLDFVHLFISRIRGGLGVVVVVTCGIIGAISGSSMTGVAAIGPILFPAMIKEGYLRGYSAALITCSSILGLLIPPSTLMIIYGWITRTSILACFLSTVGPGLLLILLFSIINLIVVRKMPLIVQQQPLKNFKEQWRKNLSVTFKAIPALLIPFVILGGIYGGVFTPSEAAAVAVLVTIPIGFFIYRGLKMKITYEVVVGAATGTASIIIQSFVALMLTQTFVMYKIPQAIIQFIYSFTQNKFTILLIINIYLFVQGCLVDDLTGTILVAPILLPLMKELGVSPIHFAAIIGTNLAMGNVTPPFAPLLYLGMKILKVDFVEIIRPTYALLIFGYFPVILITTYWPTLSLFLPRLLGFAP
jgi:tripartite ATP-independent transporter DctM subunit